MPKKNNLGLTSGQQSHFTRIVNEFKKLADEEISKLESQANDIREFHSLLVNGNEDNQALKDHITSINTEIENEVSNIKQKIEKIDDFYNKVFTGPESDSIEEQINQSIEDISKIKEELNEYTDELFGSTSDDGKRKGGIQQKINIRSHEIKDLKNKIEGLLPGATAAGLAHAYSAHKKTFKRPKYIRQALFVSSLVSMTLVMLLYHIDTEGITDPIYTYLYRLMVRTPILFPLIRLAIFASKQQSKSARLEQEYAYKEVVARSFEGFYREAQKVEKDNEGADKLSIALLEKVIEMTGYNPSPTLDNASHNEKPPITGDTIKRIKENLHK